jgi:hypothetical protein
MKQCVWVDPIEVLYGNGSLQTSGDKATAQFDLA